MNKHLSLILVSLSLVSSYVFADFSRTKCEKVLTASGDVLIQRDYDENSRSCFISIHPMDVVDLKYRDYYFDNAGLFMVFNSYGDGPNSTMTGTRGFYLFPQVQDYPDYSIESNGDVRIQTVSGHEIVFDSKKLKIKSFVGGTFTEKILSSKNQGGTEIKPGSGFYLDIGFKLGGLNNENSKNTTQAIGSKSGQCALKNIEIFHYDLGQYSNPLLYTGKKLELFLQKRCNIKF